MWEHNGKLYARVSDVLKPFTDFGDIDTEVLNRKAALGTAVHDLIDQEINGYFPVALPTQKGYLQSFYQWRSVIHPVFIESEMRYYCDEKMITGRIDTLIKLEGEEEAVLVDFKTSVQESPIIWPMQAHLYHYLLTIAGKAPADRFLFVKLDRYGGIPKVFHYKFDTNLMKRCLQAVDSFWKDKCCD